MSNFEQKGSLLLRSDHMDYGRATLVSNWHQAREAEPKDHDVKSRQLYDAKNRNLHQSTYDRILNVTDGTFPMSTCHDHMNQVKLKADFEEKVMCHPMVDTLSFRHVEPRFIQSGDGERVILPRHPVAHNKRYLNTTYKQDYRDIYPSERELGQTVEVKEDNNSIAYKKCHSQFTDTDDYRRHGRNTWLDETGEYANSAIKSEVLKNSNPIPERLL